MVVANQGITLTSILSLARERIEVNGKIARLTRQERRAAPVD
jgi:hypothetical protein